uniref:NADH-ubiquinone oxidoreductase chain 2 n=1 Tax=Parasitus wangdunqingi TaxID=2695866 RepID=A0A6B9WEB2_9ACAR|nr:NADH dehydrogenase subunit 2 [Parasitus wangdunqingi]
MFSSMNFLFTACLGLSTIFALSSDNWFQIWAALEINMMMFIPLMFSKDNLSINSMMKYFIIQAFASSLFICTMILSQSFFWESLNSDLIMLAMTVKLGLFPVYFWFPQVSEGLSWFSFTLLSTWQKIIPLYIMAASSKMLMGVILASSAMIGCISMINQNSLRKIFAFSSLTHMSWMLLSMLNNNTSWFLYFIIYTMIMISIYLIMNKINASTIDSIKYMFNKNQNMALIISLMSLGGLPPFLGFLPKWMVISNTIDNMYFFMFILIISSLISIFIYLRLTYPLLFNKMMMMNKTSTFNNMNSSLINTLLLIPMVPMVMF